MSNAPATKSPALFAAIDRAVAAEDRAADLAAERDSLREQIEIVLRQLAESAADYRDLYARFAALETV